jgi:uncharacterized protein
MKLRGFSRRECLHHLALVHVGRVGVHVQAMPAVMPVAFDVKGESVVFAVAPGSPLAGAVENSVVAFQVDNLEPAHQKGWTVMGVGVAKHAHLDASTAGTPVPWVEGEKEGQYLELEFELLTGHEVL